MFNKTFKKYIFFFEFFSLLKNQKFLEELQLKKIQKLTSKSFRFYSPKLKLIKLSNLKLLQADDDLCIFFKNHQTLESVLIEENADLSAEVIEIIAKFSNKSLVINFLLFFVFFFFIKVKLKIKKKSKE